ncbi:MAG: universal stress protein [Labilithrix sp.]|nr:universal stress protein [Labilithrix sp.]MCW5812582.1 universal stress protein [Labilithrix sp.]
MRRIEMILVPIDFGPPSDHALDFAVDLAESLDAKVHVISAFQLPIVGFPDGVLVASADVATRLVQSTEAALKRAAERHRDRKVVLTTHIEQGDPREVILSVAKDVRADLIVMGTHGRKGLARALVGSVAEAVLRTAEVPVVTVH